MSTSLKLRAPHWLALGALGLAAAGCQAEDHGRKTRDEAFSLVMDALTKVRAVEASASAIAASLPAGAAELRDAVIAQRERLGAIKDALGSYGARAEAIAECECNGTVEDFGHDVDREIAALSDVGSALNAVKAKAAEPPPAAPAPAPEPATPEPPAAKKPAAPQKPAAKPAR